MIEAGAVVARLEAAGCVAAAEEAAVYMRMGIDTSPKEIVPDPKECGGMRWPPRPENST